MKKILTGCIIVFSSYLSIGQGFSVNDTDTLFFGNASDNDFSAKFILFNDSTTSFPMSWEIVSENVETGWDYSVCDPSNCYPIGVSSSSFNLSLSAMNRIMNLHYYPNGNTGQSVVTVKIWPNNSPADSILLTWTGVVSSVGINDVSYKKELSVFPNPSEGLFTVSSSAISEGQIYIYDLQGKLVHTEIFYGGMQDIDLTSLENGMYALKIQNADGLSTSQKIVIK